MDDKKLSIERIFWTDYITSTSTIAILIFVGFFLFDRFIQPFTFTKSLPFITVVICVAGITAILWRVRLISSAFEAGWEVQGDIIDVSFFRDRGSVTYVYTIQGEKYKSSNAVMKHRLTQSLYRGQKVVVMANRDHPKVAFIRDIYI